MCKCGVGVRALNSGGGRFVVCSESEFGENGLSVKPTPLPPPPPADAPRRCGAVAGAGAEDVGVVAITDRLWRKTQTTRSDAMRFAEVSHRLRARVSKEEDVRKATLRMYECERLERRSKAQPSSARAPQKQQRQRAAHGSNVRVPCSALLVRFLKGAHVRFRSRSCVAICQAVRWATDRQDVCVGCAQRHRACGAQQLR